MTSTIFLFILFLLQLSKANTTESEHAKERPIVGNWTNAEWFNGLIKIPLTNSDGFVWVGNL